MLILYAVPVSNFCATVRLVLKLKGVPFEERRPPEGYGSPAYKALVPTGTVPAIVDGELRLSESGVIAEYLDERFGEPRLVPAADAVARARVRWLARLHDSRIEPPLRTLFAHMSPSARDEAVVDREWTRLAERFRDLATARTAGPWLAGQRPTLADYAYPATLLLAELMGAELDRTLPLPSALQDWWARLRADPVVADELEAYGEAVDAWLDQKRGQD